MVGGEALSPKHINRIRMRYPHLKIRNNYGPTENTIFSTSFLIDKTYEHNIPIGSPISHRRAYILDEELKAVPPHKAGLLYVAGDGLARGYLNLPIETLRKFVLDPFIKGERMYSTGDLCRYNADGNIEYIGRIDDQVKVRGHRIELGEIEAVLRSFPSVNQALVLYKELGTSTKGLAAYIEHSDSNLASIKEYLNARLPQYMIPNYFEEIEAFPITFNGKLDRKAMLAWPLKHQQKPSQNQQSVRDTILTTCCWVLNLNKLDPKDSFFDMGGDSLSGTCLIIELEQLLNIELPLHVLYENPVIEEFILQIENLGSLPDKANSYKHRPENLAQDAQLNFDIELDDKSIHSNTGHDSFPESIFLTGCTGFFGAFLLKELLNSSTASIYCLVRAKDKTHAEKRIQETMDKYGILFSKLERNRIIGVPGDLTQENLGLCQARFKELNQHIDMIIHNGAIVNYVDSYATLKQPNVFGTHEVIRLSCHKRIIPVHYVSSISVFETLGFFTGREVISEHESVDVSEHYVKLGYSQSKWVAEKMMENARTKGLPINIYRSAYIMGHSQTGVSNTTDHIARYIAGCIEMGCAPILTECASLTPVDQLSKALSYIAMNTKEQGQTYHLCNPKFITVSEIYQQIQDFGFPLELISYSEWKERLKKVPNTNPLYPLLSLHIHSAPNHELTLPELYENNARFDCQRFTNALKHSGIDIGLKDPSIFERWLHNYVDAGLISKETFNKTQSENDHA
jgi:thioester reductase-like protein